MSKKKNISVFVLACSSSLLFQSCSRPANPIKTFKSSLIKVNKETNQVIGDSENKFHVISKSSLQKANILSTKSLKGQLLLKSLPQGSKPAESIADTNIKVEESKEESLLVGIPIGLLGEQNIFGGVITKVTDKVNENLGSLKLTDVTPLHVRTLVTGIEENSPAVTLVGCVEECNEDSEQQALFNFPIVGFLEQEKMVVLDLAPIGKELDLITMLDPRGDYTGLKAIDSATTAFDYSHSSLIFDIKTKMIPKKSKKEDPTTPITEFVVRWYLKLNSNTNPSFKTRPQAEGVGYFTTTRSSDVKITRFSKTNYGMPGVHYYLKNIPLEHREAFAKSINGWNEKYEQIIGRKFIGFEFVEKNDPRYEELVPGDVRYNIIEWDLENKASYGGLGPSIANQFTGETFSANILIQGPTIIEIYSNWFKISAQAKSLIAQGKEQEAQKLIMNFNLQAKEKIEKRSERKFAIKLGKHVSFTVHAQRPELEDPMLKGDFELIPDGLTYEQYMAGYFQEMLEHEMGHNLGLRHNFKGNLGSNDSRTEGSTSRSIMEYLGRGYRHLNRISDYDSMAIAYGYNGDEPQETSWFCTDEDVAYEDDELKFKSAECTKDDATNDPFSYFQSRLQRGIDLVIAKGSTQEPIWETKEVKSKVNQAVKGLAAYALSAEATAATWTNFFGKLDRPESSKDVKNYVIEKIKAQVCNKEIQETISLKESEAAKLKAEANMKALSMEVIGVLRSLNIADSEMLKCESN